MLLKFALLIVLFQPVEPTVTLVFGANEPTVAMTVTEAQKRLKTETDLKWQVALTLALGTSPAEPRCITWEQHVAEVTSWWAAPERVYVDCEDPRVGPPGGKQ